MRETEEETGLLVRLGPPLPEARYTLLGRDGIPDDKVVRYWSARVTGGHGRLVNEIDEVAWLDVPSAHSRLDYARDREQLLALVRLQQTDRLDTWPLVLVRHAHAVPRGVEKPTTPSGHSTLPAGARATALAPVLAAYGVTRVVSSPSQRCADTVAPFAVRRRASAAHPGRAVRGGVRGRAPKAHRHLRRMLDRGEPALLCTHGPVVPTLMDDLERRLDLDAAGSVEVVEEFAEARDDKLFKGEALVCHVVGRGDARVVAVERRRCPERGRIPLRDLGRLRRMAGCRSRLVHPQRVGASPGIHTFTRVGQCRPPP